MKPITVPNSWPENYPSPRNKFIKKHPVWGWLFAIFLDSKHRSLEKEVEKKLKERAFPIEEAWGKHSQLLPIVKKFQILFHEQLWDFQPVFIPNDSYWLLGKLITGDLCEIEMIMAIEEQFNIVIPRI